MEKNCPTDNKPVPLAGDNGPTTQAEAAAKPAAPDLFADLASLRLSQDFAGSIGVKKVLLTAPVRKPANQWFVTHPKLRIETCVLELKDDRETYLVAPALWPELASESTLGPRALFAAMNRQAVLFIWPIRLPGPDDKLDDWNRREAEANPGGGRQRMSGAAAPVPPPEMLPANGRQAPLLGLLRTALQRIRAANGDRVHLLGLAL